MAKKKYTSRFTGEEIDERLSYVQLGNITGYVYLDDTASLPDEPSTLGYIVGNNLYVYVGSGGDTMDGLYQDCGQFKGPKGDKGDTFTFDDLTEEEVAEIASLVPALYKEATLNYYTGEDTISVAIMESGMTIAKVKTQNVAKMLLSYGSVVKQEVDLTLGEQSIALGDADFMVVNIVRIAASTDAAVGITMRTMND